MTMTRYCRVLIIILSSFAVFGPLTGCTFGANSSAPDSLNGHFQGTTQDFKDALELVCADTSCPESAGMLIGFRPHPQHENKTEFFSCGASLVEKQIQITTAGHCDPFVNQKNEARPWERIVFVTVATSEKPSEIRDVTHSLFNIVEIGHPESPDVSLLALDTPISSRKALRVARKAVNALSQFKAYVIDRAEGDTRLRFVMSAKTCTVLWQTIEHPFVATDHPDTLRGWDCEVRPKNSGAPIFFDNQTDRIDAVLSGGDNAIVRKLLCDREKRSSCPSSTLKDQANGTPLACLKLPGVPAPDRCIHADAQDLDERRRELFRQQESLQAELLEREDTARNLPFLRWPIPIELKPNRNTVFYGIPQNAYGFYLFMIPKCLRSGTSTSNHEFEEKAAYYSVRKDAYTRLISERVTSSDIPVQTAFKMAHSKVTYRYGLPQSPAPSAFLGFSSIEDGQAVLDLMRGQEFVLDMCPK